MRSKDIYDSSITIEGCVSNEEYMCMMFGTEGLPSSKARYLYERACGEPIMSFDSYFLNCIFWAVRNHGAFDHSVVRGVIDYFVNLVKTTFTDAVSECESEFDNDITHAFDGNSIIAVDNRVLGTTGDDAKDNVEAPRIFLSVSFDAQSESFSSSANESYMLINSVEKWFGGRTKMSAVEFIQHLVLYDMSVFGYPYKSAVEKQIDAFCSHLFKHLVQLSSDAYHLGVK